MDAAVAERTAAIIQAYRVRLRSAVSAHWANRAAAINAVSLYYETQAPHWGDLDFLSGLIVNARSRDLLRAFRTIFEVHPPSKPADVLNITAPDLRYAREVLILAGEARLFHEHRDLLLLGLIEARLDPEGLAFLDPLGVTDGSAMQAVDELNDGYQAVHDVSIDALNARLRELSKIEERERPEATLRAMEWSLSLRDSQPKRARREPRVWPLLPEAIARIYEPQATYRGHLGILGDIFLAGIRDSLPQVADHTKLGPATWREIVDMFAFLTALSHHHHDLPRLQDVPQEIRRRSDIQLFVPGLPPMAPSRRIPVTVLSDYVVDTSRGAVLRLACNLLGIARASAEAILDACILRILPEQTALHNFVFSNLVEIGPGRLLIVPTLGLYTADPDTILRLARMLDPLNYETLIGGPLGKASLAFMSVLQKDPDLRVVADKPLLRPNGQKLTDIDLGVYDRRDNSLALMEFKSLWLQDAETLRSVDDKLQRAAGQLTRVVAHMSTLGPAGIGALFGVEITSMPRLCPVIVTRRQYAAGSRVDFPVLPHATLRRLLREAGNRIGQFAKLSTKFDPSMVASMGRRSWHLFKINGLSWKAPSVQWPAEIATARRFAPPIAAVAVFLGLAATALAQASAPQNAGAAPIAAARIAAVAAIVGAVLSFLAVVFNEFRRRANDRRIARFNAELQERLGVIKRDNDAELARISAELKVRNDLQLAEFNKAAEAQLSADAARRAYEYEARKRLYHDCEPLLFQLAQTARVAIGRTISLARAARQGELDGMAGLLSGELDEDSGRGYYFRSTLYQLLAPLCIAYILQSRLTLRDTSLDQWINRQFFLSEAAYKAFSRDFLFAAQDPVIAGYRETADRANLPAGVPGHAKQGVFLGRLDTAIDSLVDRKSDPARVITFGRFEQLVLEPGSELARGMAPFVAIFAAFHPRTRPVCWRILVAQYYLFRAIRLDRRASLEKGAADDTLTEIAFDPMAERDLWWKDVADEEVTAPLRIGHAYLARGLGIYRP